MGSENSVRTSKKVTVVILATLSSNKKAERRDFDNTKYIQANIDIVVICKKIAGIVIKEFIKTTTPMNPTRPCV